MAEILLQKCGGLLFGVDEYSRSYIKKQSQGGILRVKAVASKKQRRLVLNSYSHAIYREAEKMKAEAYAADEKAFCKYHYGIPILCDDLDDGDETRSYYERLLGGYEDHEAILKALAVPSFEKFHIPVTSIMTDEQMSEYLKRVLDGYAEQGCYILNPKDRDFINYPEAQQ